VLLAFSYPPDTFAITDTAKVIAFKSQGAVRRRRHPHSRRTRAVRRRCRRHHGHRRFRRQLPGIKWYIAHKEIIGREPDRWASPITLRQPPGAAAGDRTRRQDRSCRGDQGDQHRARFETIIGTVSSRRAAPQYLVGWPVAGQRLLRYRPVAKAGAKRRSPSGVEVADCDWPAAAGSWTLTLDIVLPERFARRHVCADRLGLTLQYGVARIMNLS